MDTVNWFVGEKVTDGYFPYTLVHVGSDGWATVRDSANYNHRVRIEELRPNY